MEQQHNNAPTKSSGFGTAAVYLTSVSSILGAILFLRFGYAVGTLGFWGTLGIIVLGHTITIPTALAISELATNRRVEGGGEYFIMSRSLGLKIGSTIGLTLFLSQAISIAFYIIAFTEAFGFLFDWVQADYGLTLPRQAVSIPVMVLTGIVILRQGAGSGMKLLYLVTALLGLSIVLFLAGNEVNEMVFLRPVSRTNWGWFNTDRFFMIFAICFPAFTGMTAGVGMSGDLRNPSRAIPLGTMLGTLTGLVVYALVIWKLTESAPAEALVEDQMIMSRIALFGQIVVPLGLAASTFSSALGAMMVAPRTLQAIAADGMFPFKRLNRFFARGRGATNEPYNATVIVFAIAIVFVLLGDVDSVAGVISMFFLITYGTLCLNSFLNHFGSPPSYRPRFKSRWYFSLAGFLLSIWVMFMIDPLYTIVAYATIVLVYLFVEHYNKDRQGLVSIFKGALFQLNRQLRVYMQKQQSEMELEEWRPAAICVSSHSFEREKVLELMKWISHRHGFGTYFHLIEGYYSRQTCAQSKQALDQLVANARDRGSTLYLDTMISPSYTSAIAQVIQTPSISGMENNMVIFEYDKRHPDELSRILENVNLVRAGDFDIGIYALSEHFLRPSGGVHVWIREYDAKNTNFMILLSYVISSHPDWRRGRIKIFLASTREEISEVKQTIEKRIAEGRLPITLSNIEIVMIEPGTTFGDAVAARSSQAGLTIIGFREELLKRDPLNFFADFNRAGDILFVNASQAKEIG